MNKKDSPLKRRSFLLFVILIQLSLSLTAQPFPFFCSPYGIDIDVDTNMDGTIDDDLVEMDMKCKVVNVNNDSDVLGNGIDNQDNVINGTTDMNEMSLLKINQGLNIPLDYTATLKVSPNDASKIRIFDENGIARIGPPNLGSSYEIPISSLNAGALYYRLEGIHHGSIVIELELKDQFTFPVISDKVRIAINIDRTAGETSTHIRNYVYAEQSIPDVQGIYCQILASEPKITWGRFPLRKSAASVAWCGIAGGNALGQLNYFLQTGATVEIEQNTSTKKSYIYAEIADNYLEWVNGTDPEGYQVYKKLNSSWSSGDYSIYVHDPSTGEVRIMFNNQVWRTEFRPILISPVFEKITCSTEQFQSLSRTPGSSPSKASFDGIIYYSDSSIWLDANLSPQNLYIRWRKGNGTPYETASPGSGSNIVSLYEFNAEYTSSNSFQVWDNRSW